jgi:hypothetical protein
MFGESNNGFKDAGYFITSFFVVSGFGKNPNVTHGLPTQIVDRLAGCAAPYGRYPRVRYDFNHYWGHSNLWLDHFVLLLLFSPRDVLVT